MWLDYGWKNMRLPEEGLYDLIFNDRSVFDDGWRSRRVAAPRAGCTFQKADQAGPGPPRLSFAPTVAPDTTLL